MQLKRSLVLLFIALPSSTFAQMPETPQVRALGARVMSEINANLQCTTSMLALQDQLATAQAEVKRLIEKYEPKQDKPKE